jgi:hypothetical protein
VRFSATSGTTYYIQVDGVNGAQGTVDLNITLGDAPGVISQPQSQAAIPGAKVTLQVDASGAPSPKYQWYFNSTPITLATNNTLVITNFQQSQSGKYFATVANRISTATSLSADLLVGQLPKCASLSFDNSGFVNVHILGTSNLSAVLQASTDLLVWKSIATNTLPNGVWDYIDPTSRAVPSQFYRIIPGP